MVGTYGDQLRQFAQSIDIVSTDLRDRVLEMTADYLASSLDIDHCALLRQGPVDWRPGLVSDWSTGGTTWSQTLENPDGTPRSQTALAFKCQKPLWVVPKSSEDLTEESDVEDLWGEIEEEIPAFVNYTSGSIRTAVYLPLSGSGGQEILGVLDLQASERLTPSDLLRQELRKISEALGILCALERAYAIQRNGTKRAHQRLRDLSQTPIPSELSVFVAAPADADQAVIAEIREVLQDICPDYRTDYWPYEREARNIDEEIWEGISNCQFAICYFSEPADPGAETSFVDNPNVTFEAGMLQALERTAGAVMRSWIAIREEDSPEVPFDFRQHRMLRIERQGVEQDWNREAFKTELAEMIRSSLAVGS